LLSTEVVEGGGEQRLEFLMLLDRSTGTTRTVPADALFVLIGAEPHTDWLPPEIVRDERGFVLTGTDVPSEWPLERPPFMFETSVPGIFAVGDVRSRSVKRVASAVGEGSVVIQQVHQHLEAERSPSAIS
jgi:thioredoxin reductase (NADPH)